MICDICKTHSDKNNGTGKLCSTCDVNTHYSCLLDHYKGVEIKTSTIHDANKSRLWHLSKMYHREHKHQEHGPVDLV